MDSAFLDIIKLIVAGIAGGGLTQAVSAYTRKEITSAEARSLVAKTDLLEQQLRLQLTTEVHSLRLEIIDLKRRLDDCEAYKRQISQ